METPWKLILLRCGCCTGVHCSTYCACSSLFIKFWGYKLKCLRMIKSIFIYIRGWFSGFYASNLQCLKMLQKFWIILRNFAIDFYKLQYLLCMFVFVDQVLGLQAQASKNDYKSFYLHLRMISWFLSIKFAIFEKEILNYFERYLRNFAIDF